MHVILTGHRGYLGSVLGPHLREAGHEVRGIDAGFFAEGLTGPADGDGGQRRRDVRDVTRADLDGADSVVHLAALSSDPLGDIDPHLTTEINLDATVRLARTAKAAGVRRFLFSSSCSVYGQSNDNGLLDETSATRPLTAYAESKMAAEKALAELADNDFTPVFLRSATAYGWSPRMRTDLVVNDLAAQALLTGEMVLRSDGSAWRPLVHVEDIARAFSALLSADPESIRARAFNVGRTEENYRVRDVAAVIAGVVTGVEVKLATDAGPDRRDYRVSCDRMTSEVAGYRPAWTLRPGVQHLVAQYQRHGFAAEAAFSSRYQRLQRIAELRAEGLLDERLRWAG